MDDTDRARIEHVAALARLELTPAELARLAPEFGRILTAFEGLARASAPVAQAAQDAPARTRPDMPQASLARATLLAAAPASEDGFFLVPKTVGGAR